jgi:hypothetical protein
MDWNIIAQLIAGLLISVLASILVLRYANGIASMSTTRMMLLSLALFGLAVAVAIAPAILWSDVPRPGTPTTLQTGLAKAATVAAYNIVIYCVAAATLLLASRPNARADTLLRFLGPVIGAVGVGAVLAFQCGLVLTRLESISPWSILSDVWFPSLFLFIATLPFRGREPGSSSSDRLLFSVGCGGAALSYGLGFIQGYLGSLIS